MKNSPIRGIVLTLAALSSAAPLLVEMKGQPTCQVQHVAIFDANMFEITEERTLELQTGLNTVDWRGLVPNAAAGTILITGAHVTVVRQSVTADGPEVRGQKTPVLRLVLQNTGASGPRKVRVDYLAPGMSWKADYALVLGSHELLLDGWVGVQNQTGTDVCSDIVDLVAGDVQLLSGGGMASRDLPVTAQAANFGGGATVATPQISGTEIAGVSVFDRFRMGRNISITANASVDRFPLFQRLKLPLEQRNIFENEARTETHGRGGFTLAPRSLEVRLVSRNNSPSPLPPGTVTIYSPEGDFAQVVGQDRIPITPEGADFSVSQGRSNVLQGTRRIVDRREVADPAAPNRRKLITRVEVVIANRGLEASSAFVREGIEAWGSGEWAVAESSHKEQRLGDRTMEFKLPVPAKGSVKLEYTVESR
jgi:hypothetical protein